MDLLDLATLFRLCVVNNLPLAFIAFVAFIAFAIFIVFVVFATFVAFTAFTAFVAFTVLSMLPSAVVHDVTRCDVAIVIS